MVEAPPVPAQAPPGEGTAAGEKTENFIPDYAKDDKKSNMGMIVGLVAAALIAVAGVGYVMSGGGEEKAAPVEAAPAPPPPEKPAEPEYIGPSEEELKAQIAELVSQQSAQYEKQYEEKLKELETQLDKARKEEAARAARKAEEEQRRITEAEAEAARLEEEKKAEAEEAEAQRIAEEKKKEDEAAKATEVAKPQEPKPAPAAAKPAPKPVAAKPEVRRGDTVEPGPGVVPPELARKITPRFPEMAKRFNKTRATVQVRVLIDETGKVLKAELESEPQKFGFDSEALKAVKRSQWNPATKNGVPVKMWKTLTVEFDA